MDTITLIIVWAAFLSSAYSFPQTLLKVIRMKDNNGNRKTYIIIECAIYGSALVLMAGGLIWYYFLLDK
jgi:hypothetical protein